jgi:CRP-like cAMP-binding protein
VLCREGDIPEQLLVILDGEITLNITKEGKCRPFCVLGKSEVCGIEEIIEERPFEYTAICTSDSVEILKVDKEAVIGIVERDIKPDILKKRKQVAIELKNKNLDSSKLAIYSQKQIELTRRSE